MSGMATGLWAKHWGHSLSRIYYLKFWAMISFHRALRLAKTFLVRQPSGFLSWIRLCLPLREDGVILTSKHGSYQTWPKRFRQKQNGTSKNKTAIVAIKIRTIINTVDKQWVRQIERENNQKMDLKEIPRRQTEKEGRKYAPKLGVIKRERGESESNFLKRATWTQRGNTQWWLLRILHHVGRDKNIHSLPRCIIPKLKWDFKVARAGVCGWNQIYETWQGIVFSMAHKTWKTVE